MGSLAHLGQQGGSMASVYSVECYKCGFRRPWITVGALMATVKTANYFPAFCKTCADLVSANIKPTPPVCTECNSSEIVVYGQKTRDPGDPLHHKSDLDGQHMCPSCREYTLRFFPSSILAD